MGGRRDSDYSDGRMLASPPRPGQISLCPRNPRRRLPLTAIDDIADAISPALGSAPIEPAVALAYNVPMRHFLICLIVAVLAPALTWAEPTRPAPQIERVLVISIDGLRPDLLLRANTPTLHGMLERGSYSLWARTIPEAITLPSHTSMLTGVFIPRHGVDWNGEENRHPPKVPTLFKLAKDAGYTTAVVTGKSKFITIVDGGGVDYFAVPAAGKRTKDADTAAAAADVIRTHKPQVMFVHFADVDGAGHGIGWGTPEQIAAIEKADAAVGVVFDALREAGVEQSTLVIVSADHGGRGRGHGKDDPRSRHIPWLAVGPGVRSGFDLTRIGDLNIDTVDTFATACHYLGIPLPEHVEGKPIIQILPPDELLSPTTAPAAAGK